MGLKSLPDAQPDPHSLMGRNPTRKSKTRNRTNPNPSTDPKTLWILAPSSSFFFPIRRPLAWCSLPPYAAATKGHCSAATTTKRGRHLPRNRGAHKGRKFRWRGKAASSLHGLCQPWQADAYCLPREEKWEENCWWWQDGFYGEFVSITAKPRDFCSAITNKIYSFSVFSQAISSLLFHDKSCFTMCKFTDAKQNLFRHRCSSSQNEQYKQMENTLKPVCFSTNYIINKLCSQRKILDSTKHLMLSKIA